MRTGSHWVVVGWLGSGRGRRIVQRLAFALDDFDVDIDAVQFECDNLDERGERKVESFEMETCLLGNPYFIYFYFVFNSPEQCQSQCAPDPVAPSSNAELTSHPLLRCIGTTALAFPDTVFPGDRVRRPGSAGIIRVHIMINWRTP